MSLYRNFINGVILFALVYALEACVNEPDTISVRTGSIGQVDQDGVDVVASIRGGTPSLIGEYGFLWSITKNADLYSGFHTVVGKGAVSGGFQGRLQSDIESGKTYWVRAYAYYGSMIYYGDNVSFIGKGSSSPAISSVTPLMGSSGNVITIIGSGFSSVTTKNTVRVGPYRCHVISASGDKLSIQLPAGITTSGPVKVTVEVTNGVGEYAQDFILTGPLITKVSPQTGLRGTIVTITGTGFDASISGNEIWFGSVKAVVQSASATELKVVVPKVSSVVAIRVIRNGITMVYSKPFVVEEPEITSVSPASAYPGMEITLKGKHFDTTVDGNVIHIPSSNRALSLKVTTTDPTELKFILPYELGTGVVSGTKLRIAVEIKSSESVFDKQDAIVFKSQWSSSMDNPGATFGGTSGVVVGDHLYFGFGQISSGCNQCSNKTWVAYDLRRYPSLTEVSESKASFPGKGRRYAIPFVIGSKIYVAGGNIETVDGNGNYQAGRELWEYSIDDNSWTQKNDLPVSCWRETADILDVGGKKYLLNDGKLFEYNPVGDVWFPLKPVAASTPHKLLAMVINGKIYWRASLSSFYEYTPASDTWSKLSDLPAEISSINVFEAFGINGKGYIIGVGEFSDIVVYSYDPSTNLWQRLGNASSFPIPFPLYASKAEYDGEMYFVGGDLSWLLMRFNPEMD